MFDRILMDLYDDYANDNLASLYEFSQKTLPNDGTSKLFVGCVLILFSQADDGFKSRCHCTREKLLEIVKAVKEKIGKTNLLAFYVDRISTKKGIKKYFQDFLQDENIDSYANLIIEYLEQFKPHFINEIKRYEDKINEYIENNN